MRFTPWCANRKHAANRLVDQAVQVDQAEPRGGAPVTEQPRLDVLLAERLAQEQRIIEQVDLGNRHIVDGVPVALHQIQLR